jgi:LemA protein
VFRQKGLGSAFVLLILVGMAVLFGASSYNRLVALDQGVRAQWGQVENVYQRRLDLVPNLVSTVKGAAKFEQGTFSQVAQARAAAAAAPAGRAVDDKSAFQTYENAQQGLTSALGRLMVVVEAYPQLRATENFRDLQTQLEGTENRIAVERMRFNEAAQRYNTYRQSFPAVIVAQLFGGRFPERPYFQAQAGAETAPQVQF